MPNTVTTQEHFGACPSCGQCDLSLNIGRNHWHACTVHKVRWCIGSNLFSSWREETEETWRVNAERLAGFTEIEPIYPTVDQWQVLADMAYALDNAGPRMAVEYLEAALAAFPEVDPATDFKAAVVRTLLDNMIDVLGGPTPASDRLPMVAVNDDADLPF
jgi:hypothetical protein